ncbi:MAG: hypothetical protein QXN34_06940 [Archaeoglobaceae archaeon]
MNADALKWFHEGRGLLVLLNQPEGRVSVFLKHKRNKDDEGKLRLFMFPDITTLAKTISSPGGRFPAIYPLPFAGFLYVLERQQISKFIRAAKQWEILGEG